MLPTWVVYSDFDGQASLKQQFSFVNSKNVPKASTWINPVNQGINHSPPYLLGVTQLESNKDISEEVERKKEHDPA